MQYEIPYREDSMPTGSPDAKIVLNFVASLSRNQLIAMIQFFTAELKDKEATP